MGVIGVGANMSRLDAHGRTGCPPTPLLKNAASGLGGAAAEVAADDRMAGERHDEQLRVRDQRRDLTRVGGRCAQVLGAGEDQRRHVRQWRRGVGGAAEASGQPAQVGTRLLLERGRRVERVEVRARQGMQSAERFGESRRRCAPSAARGTAPPRTSSSRTALRRSPSSLLRPRGCSARSGSAPRRAVAGAAADRGRCAAPSAPRPAAARAAPGSGRPPRGCRAGPTRSTVAAWRRPEPS